MRAISAISAMLLTVAAPAAFADDVTAIVGASVYPPGDAGPTRPVTIVMRDGRIADAGPDIDAPAGADVIDASGLIATPSLMNPATQLGLVEISSVDVTVDTSQSATGVGASFDVQYALNPASEFVAKARADGLSRAVVYPDEADDAKFSGLGALLRITDDGFAVERAQAALYVVVGGSDSESRGEQWQAIRQWLGAAGRRDRDRRRQVLEESYALESDLDVIRRVASGDLPLVVETHRESDVRQAVALADDYGVRVIVMGGVEAWAAADVLAAHRIPVIMDPALNLPLYFDRLRAREDSASVLHDAGVLMAFRASSIHTTYNAGYSLREVAGIAAANGLDRSAAMAAITSNPARIWGVGERTGTIAPGFDADIVLWDGDPLEPTSAPVRVFIAGREVSLETRQTLLRDRYLPAR